MSVAPAAVDKAIVVVEVDPNTLFVAEGIVGKVMLLFPDASCVTINVPYEPTAGVEVKLNVPFPVKVTLAFKPLVGFQLMVGPYVKA